MLVIPRKEKENSREESASDNFLHFKEHLNWMTMLTSYETMAKCKK